METKKNPMGVTEWYYEYESAHKIPKIKYINIFNYEITDVRYVLGATLDESVKRENKVLICIGVNPSTAIPLVLDPTLIRVHNHANNMSYKEWYMLNIYPQRATNPNDMHKKDERDDKIHKKNLEQIKVLLDKLNKIKDMEIDVWCAWGNLITKRDYLHEMQKDIITIFKGRKNYVFKAYGATCKGEPRHPLTMGKDDTLHPINDLILKLNVKCQNLFQL